MSGVSLAEKRKSVSSTNAANNKSQTGPVIKFRSALRNTILDVLQDRGWREAETETDWDFNWADKDWIRESFDITHFRDNQRVNHFRNFYEIARKDLLIKNLKRTRKQLEREDKLEEALNIEVDDPRYDFFPASFNLPAEYSLFVEEFKKCPGAFWIMKPIAKSQGKGIFLFNKLSQINEWKKWRNENSAQAEAYIVQRYIENPYLIDIHLTNVAIQKNADTYNPQTGYDILIDDELKPWILEVNSSPSLSTENPADYQIKWCLLHDTMGIH